MKLARLHNHDRAERRAALARAAVLDLAVSLMGLILFLQTKNMICLIVGVALGAAIFVSALVKYVRAGRQNKSSHFSGPKVDAGKREHPAGSNVTPFRRPASEKTPHNSNRTSA